MIRVKKILFWVGLITLLGSTVLLAGSTQAASSSYPHHAGVVIKFSDGSVQTACVDLGEDGEASGYDVLRAANVSVVAETSGMGTTICKINQDGCDFPSDPCFCQCMMNPGEDCIYWAYHHLVNGAWEYSNLGASSYTVESGDVEGWGWGVGALNSSGSQPPVMTFDQICVPPTATPGPTNTPLPTYTPVPSAQFWADATEISAGTCTTLHWITENMPTVILDGDYVPGSGTRSLCPCQDEGHRLQVTHPDGTEQEFTVALTVSGSCSGGTQPSNQSPVATPTPNTVVAAPTPVPTARPVSAAAPVPPTPTSLSAAAPQPAAVQEAPSADGLMQPTQVAMVAADSELAFLATATPAAVPTRHALQGEPVPVDADTGGLSLSQMVGYLVFGILLVGLGSGYIFLKDRSQ